MHGLGFANACVVDEGVEPAKALFGQRHRLGGRIFPRDIQDQGGHLGRCCALQGGQAFGLLVDGQHLPALGQKLFSRRAANALRGPGDHDDLVMTHAFSMRQKRRLVNCAVRLA